MIVTLVCTENEGGVRGQVRHIRHENHVPANCCCRTYAITTIYIITNITPPTPRKTGITREGGEGDSAIGSGTLGSEEVGDGVESLSQSREGGI